MYIKQNQSLEDAPKVLIFQFTFMYLNPKKYKQKMFYTEDEQL